MFESGSGPTPSGQGAANPRFDRGSARVRSIGLRGWVTIALYQALFVVVMLGYGPLLLWRSAQGGYRRGLRERMGYVPSLDRSDGPILWLHGVSVGEIKAAATLLSELRTREPRAQLVVSATTPTGHQVARQDHPDLHVIFYPLDFGRMPGRALDRIQPDCVLLMELEIWPNFLTAARRRGVPVAVVNGRISEPTFRGYRRVRWLLPQLDWIESFCVQDRAYERRIRALRIEESRIQVTGNVKYDSVLLRRDEEEWERLRSWLAHDGRPVVVGGSTHADEELWLARAVQEAAAGRPVRLVLVPRHPERGAAVADQLSAQGFSVTRWSNLSGRRPAFTDAQVLLVDTVGLLQTFYGACDVAFVGGSLVPHGGQNMLEPAALGKAVVFGPHTTNFRTDVRQLLECDAALQVGDAKELSVVLARLLGSGEERRALGERAFALVQENRGATARTLQCLEPLLPAVG